MSGRETAEVLLLAGRLVQAEGYHGELSPAQWSFERIARNRFFAFVRQSETNASAELPLDHTRFHRARGTRAVPERSKDTIGDTAALTP